jgi:hypothetical protein
MANDCIRTDHRGSCLAFLAPGVGPADCNQRSAKVVRFDNLTAGTPAHSGPPDRCKGTGKCPVTRKDEKALSSRRRPSQISIYEAKLEDEEVRGINGAGTPGEIDDGNFSWRRPRVRYSSRR